MAVVIWQQCSTKHVLICGLAMATKFTRVAEADARRTGAVAMLRTTRVRSRQHSRMTGAGPATVTQRSDSYSSPHVLWIVDTGYRIDRVLAQLLLLTYSPPRFESDYKNTDYFCRAVIVTSRYRAVLVILGTNQYYPCTSTLITVF